MRVICTGISYVVVFVKSTEIGQIEKSNMFQLLKYGNLFESKEIRICYSDTMTQQIQWRPK